MTSTPEQGSVLTEERIAELEAQLEEAQTIDRGFWKFLCDRDLAPDGPDIEWADIVTALEEHEIALTGEPFPIDHREER